MKKHYRQLWTSYNSRQLAEKCEFYRLLDGLIAGMDEADQTQDRLGFPVVDLSFCVDFKLYRRISGRRQRTSCRIDGQLHIAT